MVPEGAEAVVEDEDVDVDVVEAPLVMVMLNPARELLQPEDEVEAEEAGSGGQS